MARDYDDEPNAAEPFDELLRTARWPAGDRSSARRLDRRWRQLRHTDRSTVLRVAPWCTLAVGAAAAALLIVPLLRVTSPRPEPQGVVVDATPPARTLPADSATARDRRVVAEPPLRSDIAPAARQHANEESLQRKPMGRPPTWTERVVALQARRRAVGSMVAQRVGDERARNERIAEAAVDLATALQQLAEGADAAKVRQSLDLADDVLERRLISMLDDADSTEHRPAATRLLAEVGSPQSLPRLRELYGEPALREAAFVGLLRLEPAGNLAYLAESSAERDRRRQLLAALLERREPLAVELFLALVGDPATRADALAAAREASDLPIDLLLVALSSSRNTQRLWAALTLGQSRHPRVVDVLIERVLRWPAPEAALIALLVSPQPEAAAFLNYARGEPRWRGVLGQAEWKLATIVSNLEGDR